MPDTSAHLRLILAHLRGLRDTVDGVSFHTFTTSYHMERTVERATEIIARALQQLPPEVLDRHPQVEWQDIIAYARMIQDGNDSVNSALRWMLATRHLPSLEAPIVALLGNLLKTNALVRGH